MDWHPKLRHTKLCIILYLGIKFTQCLKICSLHFKMWCFKICLHSENNFCISFLTAWITVSDLGHLVPSRTHCLFHNTKIFFYIISEQRTGEHHQIVLFYFTFFPKFNSGIFSMFLEKFSYLVEEAGKYSGSLASCCFFVCLFGFYVSLKSALI